MDDVFDDFSCVRSDWMNWMIETDRREQTQERIFLNSLVGRIRDAIREKLTTATHDIFST